METLLRNSNESETSHHLDAVSLHFHNLYLNKVWFSITETVKIPWKMNMFITDPYVPVPGSVQSLYHGKKTVVIFCYSDKLF